MILDLQQFIRAEQPRWDELEGLLQRIEEDPDARLNLDQTRRFHYLYDRAASDLLLSCRGHPASAGRAPRLRRALGADDRIGDEDDSLWA